MIFVLLTIILLVIIVINIIPYRKNKFLKFILSIGIIILTFLWLILDFFLPVNSPERNKIVFVNSIQEVQDSIFSLKKILNRLPVYKYDNVKYSISDSNCIYINFVKIACIDNNKNNYHLNVANQFDNLSSVEKQNLIKLIIYLKRNFLTSCDYYKNNDFVYLTYRENNNDLGDYYDDLLRWIQINPLNIYDVNVYMELDRKDRLILTAYKNSKIWVKEN